jgi:protein-tyrosine phosphatase
VTHIVDVRGEVEHPKGDCADRRFAAEHAPEITYVFLGTHDNGSPQEPRWFDAAIEALTPALADPEAVILVHCHMGVNRGPSLGLRLLLEQGVKPFEALAAIREARPIAVVLYADDAVRHWFGVTAGSGAGRAIGALIDEWHRDNAVDTGWIISRIRRAEWDE